MDDTSDGLLLYGTLSIKIIAAKNLPDTDNAVWNIKRKDVTDPFVQGYFGEEMVFQTKHIDNELNPRWFETCYARVNHHAKSLVISVLDKDCIGTDFIGSVTFLTEDLVEEEIIGGSEGDWFPLDNNGENQGEIKLSIQFTPKDPSEDEFNLLHGRIRICINEARDLPDTDNTFLHKDVTDPFVHGDIGEARLFKTDHKNNQLNPSWNETFNVHVCHYTKSLDIIVQDKDCLGNDIIGIAPFSTKSLLNEELIGGPKGDWFPIWKDNKSCGKIKLSVKFTSKDALVDELDLEVKDAYFPLRDNCRFTLYQEAECPSECLPLFEGVTFPDGSPYEPTRCWYDLYQAISNAQKFIYITGWSVYTEIELVRGQDDPDKLSNVGRLLKAKADEGVRVILMVWDERSSHELNLLFPNGVMMTHDEATRRYFEGTNVSCVLVGRRKSGGVVNDEFASSFYSHHQKSVICDAEDTNTGLRRVIAFIGGLDITNGRYDTPEFPLFRTLTKGNIHYDDFHGANCVGATRDIGPREPWHDNHARVEGIAAMDIKQNFEDRIMKQALEVSEKLYSIEEDDFIAIDTHPNVPNNEGGLWSLQLFRSISSDSCVFDNLKRDCLHGKGGRLVDNTIQRCMIQQIRNAQNFIYMENQYFVGSAFQWESEENDHLTLAHNLIPTEIANKIIGKIKQGEMFTAYIVIPMFPEGDPSCGPLQEILYWQYRTIQSMYRSIARAIKETNIEARPTDFLKFFCLGKRESRREVPELDLEEPKKGSLPAKIRETLRQPVYVHSKMTIIDDQYILIGSANINERSLCGERDSEIAMGGYQKEHTVANEGNPRGDVHTYRMALWAAHFGGHQDVFENPNTSECRGKVLEISEQFWEDYIADDPKHCDVHMLPYPIDVDPDCGNVTSLEAPWDCFPDTTAQILGQKSNLYPVKLTT